MYTKEYFQASIYEYGPQCVVEGTLSVRKSALEIFLELLVKYWQILREAA